MIKITNRDIAQALGITTRSVQNKRRGATAWTLPEYQILIKYYGVVIANQIVNADIITNIDEA